MFQSEYDRDSELKAFDDSKSGIKGLVDAGVTKIPRIFIHPKSNLPAESGSPVSLLGIPLIDLDGVDNKGTLRAQIIDQVRDACENWGFFQVVNHEIPTSVLEEMMDGIRGFHEQDTEVKKQFYVREFKRKVSFVSNFELFHAPVATWKDTLACAMAPNPPDPQELPAVCRYGASLILLCETLHSHHFTISMVRMCLILCQKALNFPINSTFSNKLLSCLQVLPLCVILHVI